MSFYKFGDNFKWFVARVSDLNDPEYLGRVRIRIIHNQTGELGRVNKNNDQLISGISNEDLLWAWPLSGIQSASLNFRKLTEQNVGLEEFDTPDWIDAVGISPTGIAVGTYVFGFYLDAFEQNIPIIFGTYHKRSVVPEPPTGDPNVHSMLQLEEPQNPEVYSDVAALARGQEGGGGQTLPKEPYTQAKELSSTTEPPSAYNTTYPYNTTYTTKSGHAIELDDSPNHERIHIWHKSGSYEEISNGPTQSGESFKGRRVKKTTDDDYEIVLKDKNVLVKQNLNKEVGNNVTMSVAGNMRITANGGVSIGGAGGVTITEGTLSVNDSIAVKSAASGSFTTLDGKSVTVQDGIVVSIV